MRPSLICAFVCLALGRTLVSGASTTPAPAKTSPPPASSTPPPEDIGLVPPGAPDIESCSDKSSDKKPCKDKNSKCVDGRCLCNEGFSPIANDTCLKTPGLGDVCHQGDVELFCAGEGVEYFCPINGTVCQCKLGYEPDGKTSCKPAVRLVGAACKVDGDCTAAFSVCESGKCTCLEGFTADKKTSLCTPTEYKCLDKDKPLEEKGVVRLCELVLNLTTGEATDPCPPTHFCNQWPNSRMGNRNVAGHCCPKPAEKKNVTATCPIGVIHKTAKCIDFQQFPADKALPDDLGPLCSRGDGYECLHDTLCCPTPCRSSSSHFNVGGKCYDTISLDRACEFDVQCPPDSACVKGKCQCQAGFKNVDSNFCSSPAPPPS